MPANPAAAEMTEPTEPTLITGCAGFIGSTLTRRLLEAGHRVVGVDSFNDYYDPALKRANLAELVAPAASEGGAGGEGGASTLGQRFTLIEADIRDRDAMARAVATHRPGTVVHLAAMAGVRPSIADPALYHDVNLNGTVALLDPFVALHRDRLAGADPAGTAVPPEAGAPRPRFVFGSSSSVYGNNDKAPFAETDPVDHPISTYAATKRAGELTCHTYSHLYRLPVTCLRFFTVFGPRQRPDLAIRKFLGMVAAGEPIPMFGDGSTSRDYTYVDDICAGIEAAIAHAGEHTTDKSVPFRIYNLGGDHPITLSDLIATVGRVVGREPVIDRQPMQPGDVNRTWADLTRARAELGYTPEVGIEEGIARQWAWMRSL